MSKLPETVQVGPFIYSVKVDRQVMAIVDGSGQWGGDSLEIWMSDAPHPVRVKETLLHESLHALWHLVGLNEPYPQEEKDSPGEDIINRLAPALLSLLRDNPELVEWLQE
jgi:hypothetical protein